MTFFDTVDNFDKEKSLEQEPRNTLCNGWVERCVIPMAPLGGSPWIALLHLIGCSNCGVVRGFHVIIDSLEEEEEVSKCGK